MVRHWLATRPQGWRYRLAINSVGCVLTAVIAVVVTSIKFSAGAWFVVILIPTLVSVMLFIRRQYDGQARELAVRDDLVFDKPHREQRVVIPVNGINRSVVQAVMFGRSLVTDPSLLQAVFVTTDAEEAEAMRDRWDRQLPGVPLVIVESPYRALVGPLVTYLDVLDLAWPPDREAPVTIVVLPEYVAKHWWDRLLYNQAAKRLKAALVGREHTVIADVPYRRSEEPPVADAPAPDGPTVGCGRCRPSWPAARTAGRRRSPHHRRRPSITRRLQDLGRQLGSPVPARGRRAVRRANRSADRGAGRRDRARRHTRS